MKCVKYILGIFAKFAAICIPVEPLPITATLLFSKSIFCQLLEWNETPKIFINIKLYSYLGGEFIYTLEFICVFYIQCWCVEWTNCRNEDVGRMPNYTALSFEFKIPHIINPFSTMKFMIITKVRT